MFIVQTAARPVAQHLVELLIMVNAAKLASAKRITAVIPWYFYARQDKKSRPREPITARMVADLLETVGVDRVITMDLHAGQVQGFFRIPVDHMVAVPMFAQYVRDLLGPGRRAGRRRARHGSREARRQVRRDDRRRARRPQQGAAGPQPGARDRRDRRGRGQGRGDDRRHHRHGRNALRGRRGTAGSRRDAGLRVRDTRAVNGPRSSGSEKRLRAGDRHGHRSGQPAERSRPTSKCSRSPACWPRRSRTCSPTTRCRRSSPARTSCSRETGSKPEWRSRSLYP